jgi:flagellar biosynthesis/type III secretory pathway M-ring protein FliF/YscJ
MGTPQTWADIAERLGIPFAIVLLLFFFAAAAAMWFARHVVRPLTAAHLGFVDQVQKTQTTIADTSQKAVGQNDELLRASREHDRATRERLERIAEKLERSCPLLANPDALRSAEQKKG